MITIAQGLDGKFTVVKGAQELEDSEALDLAALIAFHAKGHLVSSMQDGRVVAWNTEGPFFKAYRKIMERP